MCKVFAMTNVSQFKMGSRFLSIVRNEVCRHADQDGFGYAVLGKNGDIGGERTMRPLNFKPLIDPDGPKVTKQLPIVLDANNRFGKIDLTSPKSLIAHGRLSTNSVSLINTHPFTNGEVALIHNGVVRDPTGSLKNLVSTCDSEILLRYWEKGGIEAIEKMVTGYYAIGVLDKYGLMHIARDDRADLFMSYCRTVDSFIIATTAEIINNVAKEMKWKIEHPEEILEKSYTVFDGNAIVSHRTIAPRTTEYGGGGYPYANESWKGNNYSTIEHGKKSTGTTAASSSVSSASGSSTGSGVTRYPSEGGLHTDHEGYGERDPEREVVPKYRELTGRVAADSSASEATSTAFETTDQSGWGSSEVDGSSVRMGLDEGHGHDERLEMIVEEVEGWRSGRTGTDV
jgi:predicted glutamine amidotransferase